MFTLRLTESGECEIVEDNSEVAGIISPYEEGVELVSNRLLNNPEQSIKIDRSRGSPKPVILIKLT